MNKIAEKDPKYFIFKIDHFVANCASVPEPPFKTFKSTKKKLYSMDLILTCHLR